MRVVYGTPLVNKKWLDNYTHELLHMSFNCILEHNEGSYNTSHVSESNPTISDVTYIVWKERIADQSHTRGMNINFIKTIITMSSTKRCHEQNDRIS